MEREIYKDEKDYAEALEEYRRRESVLIVQGMIREVRERLESTVQYGDHDTINVFGKDQEGNDRCVPVQADEVCRIALSHDFPVWHVLQADFPDAMWRELALAAGLAEADCVNLDSIPIF